MNMKNKVSMQSFNDDPSRDSLGVLKIFRVVAFSSIGCVVVGDLDAKKIHQFLKFLWLVLFSTDGEVFEVQRKYSIVFSTASCKVLARAWCSLARSLLEDRAKDWEENRRLKRRVDELEVSGFMSDIMGWGAVEAHPSESIDVLAIYGDAKHSKPQGPPDGPKTMPPRRLQRRAVERLVANKVAEAIAEYERIRTNPEGAGGSGGNTGGDIALEFEKMESVFEISKCDEEDKVKDVVCTLEAQLKDKNIAISELEKHIGKRKGKSVETKFDKPSVVRQPNALRILKPSFLGKPTSFSDSIERKSFKMTKLVTKTNVLEACNDSLKSKTSNINVVCATYGKCVFNSNHDACVSKFIHDVNARTKKPKVVHIGTRKPQSQANKSVATPPKKIVASESSIQKSKSYYRMLYEKTSKAWKWWIAQQCPSGYK
ncbi:hypothetical protein Tco_0686589 [Tanacetum coccineum]